MRLRFALSWLVTLSFVAFAQGAPLPAKKVFILPLVTFYNSIGEGEVYNWWAERDSLGPMKLVSDSFLQSASAMVHPKWSMVSGEQLSEARDTNWFKTKLTTEEVQEFTKAKSALLSLVGDVQLSKSPLVENGLRVQIRLSIFRVKNSEKAAEVYRIHDLQPFEYERLLLASGNYGQFLWETSLRDLHHQLDEFHKKKNSSYTKLVISGNLNQDHFEKLKSTLRQRIPTIREMNVTSFENEQVHLAVLYEGKESLGSTLSQLELKNFMTQVVSETSELVVFDVKTKSQ